MKFLTFFIPFLFAMQIYAAAEAVSEVLIESEVLEKMERTTNLIRDSMHETVQMELHPIC